MPHREASRCLPVLSFHSQNAAAVLTQLQASGRQAGPLKQAFTFYAFAPAFREHVNIWASATGRQPRRIETAGPGTGSGKRHARLHLISIPLTLHYYARQIPGWIKQLFGNAASHLAGDQAMMRRVPQSH